MSSAITDIIHVVLLLPLSQLMEEEEELRRVAQFRAQPNRTIYKEPFIPAKSTKPLTGNAPGSSLCGKHHVFRTALSVPACCN